MIGQLLCQTLEVQLGWELVHPSLACLLAKQNLTGPLGWMLLQQVLGLARTSMTDLHLPDPTDACVVLLVLHDY